MSFSSPMAALRPVEKIYDSAQLTAGLGTGLNDSQNELWRQQADFETVTTGYTISNVTLGNGTFLVRRFRVIGQALIIARLTFGSTTAVTGAVQFDSLSDDCKTTPMRGSGRALYYDSSANDYHLGALSGTGNTVALGDHEGNLLSSTVPFTWATGDELMLSYISQERNETQVLR